MVLCEEFARLVVKVKKIYLSKDINFFISVLIRIQPSVTVSGLWSSGVWSTGPGRTAQVNKAPSDLARCQLFAMLKCMFFEKKLPATLWCQKIHNHFFFMKPFFTSWSMINKKFKISIYTFLNIYIHFFQSAYAAKRRIDCDCDVSMHDRCRCLRLLHNEGLWPTDKWRYHEFKSSEESLFFSEKKNVFRLSNISTAFKN